MNSNASPTMDSKTSTPAELLEQFEEMVGVSDACFYRVRAADEIWQLAERIAEGDPVVVWDGQDGAGIAIPEPQDTIPEPHGTIPGPHGIIPEPQDTIPGPQDTIPGPHGAIPGPQERTLGVVTARCGVAETGSVLLVEESQQQMLHSLLSQELLVLVHAEDVVATLPETADLVADACAEGKPVTFLSGPSRTGDIELRHVSGIQGPCEVHVALCDW